MRAIISFLVYTALVLGIPTYGAFIYDRIKAQEWKKVVTHGLIALVIVCVVFFLGWYGLAAQSAAAKTIPRLEYLNERDYEEEIKLRRQKSVLTSADQALQVIKTKFDEADYAHSRNDFDRALQLYREIDRGSDQNGTFDTFRSACIENNTAVDYFQKQGDKGFKASGLLFDAIRIDPKPQRHLDLIQRNIDAMDKYVNQ
jgi:hypothetical protein